MWMKVLILQHLVMIEMTVIQKAEIVSASEAEMEDSETDVSDEYNTSDEKKHD
jgi:hypothetical protein